MAGRIPLTDARDNPRLYLFTLQETFSHEPTKLSEFLKVLLDMLAHRISNAEGIARMHGIMKDHLMLLLGFSVFYISSNLAIPHEAYTMLDHFQTNPTMVGKRVSPVLTLLDALVYIASVKQAFHNQPTKLEDFFHTLINLTAHRVDEASAIAKVEDLMKGHRNLFLGFCAFLSADPRKTIPPKTQPDNDRRKRARVWWSRICEQE